MIRYGTGALGVLALLLAGVVVGKRLETPAVLSTLSNSLSLSDCQTLSDHVNVLESWRGASDQLLGAYLCGQQRVLIQAARFDNQTNDREAVNETNPALPLRWSRVAQGQARALSAERTVQQLTVHAEDTTRWQIWHWYSVDNRWLAGGLDTKLHELAALMKLERAITGRFVLAVEAPEQQAPEPLLARVSDAVWNNWYNQAATADAQ